MRRIIVAAAVAGGLLAVPLTFAPQSAAARLGGLPAGVARNVVAGTPCTPSTTFVFG